MVTKHKSGKCMCVSHIMQMSVQKWTKLFSSNILPSGFLQ